eukprot:CAMPEP_0197419884 /NCGR_PEP_ID=MMETSP1170-20131217/5384_1 /TAXON_ID=54406 /ORGANISM="Sarcinochrysis sp, Strain CCMP770" /LENGTH=31 /DNA_ID= /DNA_START= /DNA_END= /DNA_ORIENTATION=
MFAVVADKLGLRANDVADLYAAVDGARHARP